MSFEELRAEFLRLLTVDSETKDRRKREFNQAVFDLEGWAVWSSTDLNMVMNKFDKAARNLTTTNDPRVRKGLDTVNSVDDSSSAQSPEDFDG